MSVFLFDILTGRDTSEPYHSLDPAARQGALEILRETKRGLADYWQPRP